jgi:hypothetical protein
MKRPADIYLLFLQLTEALRGSPTLRALDPLEQKILEFVARTMQRGDRLSVRDMMAHAEFGSPATLHARITSMRENGWLTLSDTEDARSKQIELTRCCAQAFRQTRRSFRQGGKGHLKPFAPAV